MGGIIGSVTDAIGLTDHKGEAAAAAQAQQQSALSYGLTKDEVAFQRAQYNDWKNIYGPLQEDLGTYFKNISGNKLADQQIEAIQSEGQKVQQQIDKSLAQRGLSQSGLEAQSLMQNQFGTSMEKANARAKSDQLAAQQKMGFLGLGLGQGTNMLGINANVSNRGASNAALLSNTALNNATALSQMNTSIVGGMVGSAVGAFGAGGGFGSTFQKGLGSMYGGR